jgi:hypothetical protein
MPQRNNFSCRSYSARLRRWPSHHPSHASVIATPSHATDACSSLSCRLACAPVATTDPAAVVTHLALTRFFPDWLKPVGRPPSWRRSEPFWCYFNARQDSVCRAVPFRLIIGHTIPCYGYYPLCANTVYRFSVKLYTFVTMRMGRPSVAASIMIFMTQPPASFIHSSFTTCRLPMRASL